MKPYEWMVKFTPQTEWIEQRGLLVWLAEVSGGLGGGLYLVSLYLDSLWGMFVSWSIVVALKGGFHLAYLGKPLRFWRMVLKPQNSWMSRGLIIVFLFIGFGALQLITSYLFPGTAWELLFKGLAGITAFGTAMYPGFAMNYVNGIPFWNSALLPILFIVYGILDGFGIVIAIALSGGDVNIAAAEVGSRIFLIISAIILGIYLWSATYVGQAGKYSVKELLRGSVAPVLWLGVVLCGIAIPIVIVISSSFVGGMSAPLLIGGIMCDMIGGLSLKYCLLKGGIYAPLIPSTTY